MNKIQFVNIILITFIIALSIALIEVNKQQIIDQLNKWKLLPQPETFTELYFNNSTNLPSYVKQNQQIKFAFTVHNLEYKTYTYPYEIYLEQNNEKTEIKKSNFTLNQNQYKTI